jgi:threonine aldolase
MAVTITQASEAGTVYSLDEIGAISEIARQSNLPLHMDGARFANALVSLQCAPAEMTWKQGVDILSFGGTKNGCWCAEALIFMDPEQSTQMPFLRKRAGQLFSKSRFIAAQFDAYLENDLWLDLARHANAMAQTLAEEIRKSKQMRLAWLPQANEVFAIIKQDRLNKLQACGAALYDWPPPHGMQSLLKEDEVLVRLVTNFATTTEEVRRFAELANS